MKLINREEDLTVEKASFFCKDFLIICNNELCGGILLPPTCKINYVYMQNNNVHMRLIYVDKQYYVDMHVINFCQKVFFFLRVKIMFTCDLFMSSCNIIMCICDLFLSTCNIIIFKCDLFMSTCNIIMSTCDLFKSTCKIIMFTCKIFLSTCYL